jgi:phosphoglucomutase
MADHVIADTGILAVTEVATTPIEGQKPGTSGLRKKTKTFIEGHYLHNFVQSIFDSLPAQEVRGSTLVVGGDGRYWTKEACQIITKIAIANGVQRLWIGQNGLLSTPAVSAIIREREGGAAYGGIILTASHNPGGIDEDFGIKYNVSNGGPAQESLTDAIFNKTKSINRIAMCTAFPDIDLSKVGRTVIRKAAASGNNDKYPVCDEVIVEVIDSVEDYGKLLSKVFDFDLLKSFVSRPDFSMVYDALSGVAGAYATRILGEVLGVPKDQLHNCVPLPDFGGHHPDPNLTYAPDLVHALGLKSDGSIDESVPADKVPQFGAAQDGDADRNMILGKRFFVTPSDSVAVIAANAEAIPFFASKGGLKGVARSMPTSAALDRVAHKKGLQLFEVPTGWKFFGNLVSLVTLCFPEPSTGVLLSFQFFSF